MYITDIRMVNDAISNTYMIRRSAPTVGGSVTYMAKQALCQQPGAIPTAVVTERNPVRGSELFGNEEHP